MRIVSLTILGLVVYAWYQEKTIKALREEMEHLHKVRARHELKAWSGGWDL